MRDEKSVAEMADEVLMRQARARAGRSEETVEEAMEALVDTVAGKQLTDLRDGPHGEEGVEQWRGGMVRARARERAADLGGRLAEVPERPTHG